MKQLITCKILKKEIGKFQLEDIFFDLEPGYIMGVIGRNGSGKTTLLRTLMGSYRLNDHSDVIINGASVVKDVKAYKEQIAFVLNDTPFEMGSTAKEIGRLYGRYYKTFDIDKYIRLLNEFDVPEKECITNLSRGQQIKQQLAFAFSYDAKVYFFDEPTGNLDVEFRDTFYRYIREIVSDEGKCVIYVSHLVEEMEEFADYILWLDAENNVGKIRYMGSIDKLKDCYRIVEADEAVAGLIPDNIIVGGRKMENHQEVLIKSEDGKYPKEVQSVCRYADIKEIMYYTDKGDVL